MSWNIDRNTHPSHLRDPERDSGKHERIEVWNASGGTISKWMPIYFSGVHTASGLPQITKAKADAVATLAQAIVVDFDIVTGSNGFVQKDACVINTDVDSNAASVGAQLYLSASTAGTATLTEPTGGNYSQTLGRVLVASATIGEIVYHISGVSSTAALSSTVIADGGTLQIHAAAGQGYIVYDPANMGSDIALTITNEAIAAARTLKYPDSGATTGQFVVTNADQTCIIATGPADRTITMTGDLTMVGAYALTLTTSNTTNVTLPTTGTLTTLATVVAAANTWAAAQSFSADMDVTGITGNDTSLGITGKVGASSVGYPIVVAGGAGNGAFGGGLVSVTGGGSGAGATGNGGAASVVGGAALSTAGNGGAVTVTGGVATTTGTGGAINITSGASAGVGGTAGNVNLDTGTKATGTSGILAIGGTNAESISLGNAATTITVSAPTTIFADGTVVQIHAASAKGYWLIDPADQAGDTAMTLTNASQSGARTYTFPDAGANASFLMTKGAQTHEGILTLGLAGTAAGEVKLLAPTAANGQIQLKAADTGGAYTLTITNTTLAASRTVTIPDAGAASNVVLSEGAATVNGVKTFGSAVLCSAGVGAVVADTCTAAEYGDGTVHKTVLTLTLTGAKDIDIADGAAHGAGIKIYDMPAGRILLLGATCDMVMATTGINANPDDTYNVGVGTVICADDATLTGTEADIIPSMTADGATSATGKSALAASAQFDGTTSAMTVNVNAGIIDANSSAAVTLAITGTLTLTWINLGDY